MDFDIVGHGDMAMKLSSVNVGQEIEIDGTLHVHRWKTADKQNHAKWEIKISHLRVLPGAR